MKLFRLTVNWTALLVIMPTIFLVDVVLNFITFIIEAPSKYKEMIAGRSKATFATGDRFFWE